MSIWLGHGTQIDICSNTIQDVSMKVFCVDEINI